MSKRQRIEGEVNKQSEFNMLHETNSSQNESEDLNNLIAATENNSYHESVCGSILYSAPSKCSKEIFSYLQHGNLVAFQRSFDIYYTDIIQMKNNFEQSVLHILTIHAFPYQWIRLLLMRQCDPSCQDIDGYTAAHYAAERDDVEMLKALTKRFYSQVKIFSEQQVNDIHQHCLNALTIRNKQGLTPFMLACFHQSSKSIDYLNELKINDVHLEDKNGDTCLHYVVARRDENLVNKLINQYHANVNAGDKTRPSVLDILQFNREQQKPYDRTKDNMIEQVLLLNNAVNRCQIKRTNEKRKLSTNDDDESSTSKVIYFTNDSSLKSKIDTAKNYAQVASSYENNGQINRAIEFYQKAMDSIPNDILDWADYAYNLALMSVILGENKRALDLLEKCLEIRKRFENDTKEIDQIQRAIENIQKNKD